MNRFYINFGLDWMEGRANELGFTGSQWKEELLKDLLDNGDLLVWKGQDSKEAKSPEWFIQGQRSWVVCKVDGQRDDSFFCLRLMSTTQGAAQLKGKGFRISGRWSVATLGGRRRLGDQDPLEQHLDALHKAAQLTTSPILPKVRPAAMHAEPGAPKNGSPFSVLSTVVPKSVTALPQSVQSGETHAVSQPHEAIVSHPVLRSDAHVEVSRPVPVGTKAGPAPDAGSTLAPILTSSDTLEIPAKTEREQPAAGIGGRPGKGQGSARSKVEQLGPTPSSGSNSEEAKKTSDGSIAVPASKEPAKLATSASATVSVQASLSPNERRTPVETRSIQLDGLNSWDELALQAVMAGVPALAGIIAADNPLDARRQRIARLEAELAKLKEALEEVPGEHTVQEADDLRRKLLQAGSRLASTCPPAVRADNTDMLLRVMTALSGELVSRIPEWALGMHLSAEASIAPILGDPRQQALLLEALDWIGRRFAGAPPIGLESLQDPGPTGTVPERLEQAWQQEVHIRQYREEFPEGAIRILQSCQPVQLEVLVQRLRIWRDHLHSNAFAQLLDMLEPAGTSAFSACPDPESLQPLDTDDLKTLKEISEYSRAMRHLTRAPGGAVQRPAEVVRLEASVPAQLLRFDHVVTDHKGSVVAAPVIISEAEKDASYQLLDFPVRFVASAPIREPILLRLGSNGTASVPQDAQVPTGRIVREGKNAWLELPLPGALERWEVQDGGNAYREECLSLPVTLGFVKELRSRKQRTWSIEISGGGAGATLRFEQFHPAPVSLGAGTGQENETASQLIERHALGPQEDHRKLEELITEGRQAFMVVAPRRFGKTTLFHHLTEHASKAQHEVVTVTLERDLTAEQGVVRLWQQIKETLERRHKSSPALGSTLPQKLEDEAAWGHVRTFVKEKGFKVFHLLIDEAQVLVPRVGGERWGNTFKNFVENHLGKPHDGQCRVQVSLFGTVDLSVRMGQNCRDFLLMHGSTHHVFKEASLARFLRAVSQGTIVSSRRARERMVRWTNNLRTLYAVLERVRDHLRRAHRLFLLDRDVDECIQELLSPDSPHSEEVWSYVRAELSHRDEWEPVDAFPLAVAWAQVELEKMDPVPRLDACAKWLEQELQASGTSAVIARERLEPCLYDLKARGVLRDDGSFWRPVLREMIRRKPRMLQTDLASQHALLRLTVDSVSYPESRQQKDEGGQATVHMVQQGNQTLAYRVCPLETPEERRRFARTCAALRTLRDRRTRVDGDRYLPRVSEAGFRDGNPKQGIIVYDWIEGERLDRYPSDVSWELRLHIVLQIAQAVQALHAREVIHCDIAPRNILIDGRMNATLIDFGLARRTDSSTFTQLGADAFKAPEQVNNPPSAGKETDIYALGRLLYEGSRVNVGDSELEAFIAIMTNDDPHARPPIQQVVAKLRDHSRFDVHIEECKSKVDDIIQEAQDWLWEELMQFSTIVASAMAGRRRWDRHLAMESSLLLNNLFACIVNQKRGTEASALADLCIGAEISLARVSVLLDAQAKATVFPHWICKEVSAVGHLRNALAHPTDREAKVALACKTLGVSLNSSAEVFQQPVLKVAGLLDRLIGPDSKAILRFVGELTRRAT